MNGKSANYPAQVLYVWNYLDWGGAQIHFFALMQEAKKHAEVRVVLPRESNAQLLKFLKALDVPCDFVDVYTDNRPATSIKRKLQRHYNKLRAEYIFCRRLNEFDLKNAVVHADFAPWQSFGAIFWLCLRTNFFTTLHNATHPAQRWRYWIWRLKFGVLCRFKSFHIFPSNEDTKRWLGEYVPAEFQENLKVTYTSVNPPEIEAAGKMEINRRALCEKFDLPPDGFLVFCVGQFIDRKGRWVFLEAAQKLAQKFADIAFVWISNSAPDDDDWRRAESYNLGARFRLITSDQVGGERSDLFALMRLADVFVLPSFVEGLPISLLEAMSLGKPVVSTNINAIPEAVKHLETGWLIEAGDADGLSRAIETLKNDEALREKLAASGRRFALDNFDERKAAQTAWESYEQSFRA